VAFLCAGIRVGSASVIIDLGSDLYKTYRSPKGVCCIQLKVLLVTADTALASTCLSISLSLCLDRAISHWISNQCTAARLTGPLQVQGGGPSDKIWVNV